MQHRRHDDPKQVATLEGSHLDDDELEPEVLTYREFQRLVALNAWQARRRAYESGDAETADSSAAGHLAWFRQAVSRFGRDTWASDRDHSMRLG